eukprot:scaffold7871_cov376-Prasinococcus_capsulatus_cf.AAC.1
MSRCTVLPVMYQAILCQTCRVSLRAPGSAHSSNNGKGRRHSLARFGEPRAAPAYPIGCKRTIVNLGNSRGSSGTKSPHSV